MLPDEGEVGRDRAAHLRTAGCWALLTLIVIAAAVVRLYDLENNPAGLYCDEAANGYNAHAIGTAGIDEHGEPHPLFVWSFFGYKNPVYIYSALLPVQWFGLDAFSTRLPAALYGIVGVLGVFFVGRAVVSAWAGLFAAFFLAFSPWHIHFSRIAFDMTAFAALFTLGFLSLLYYGKGRRTLPLAMLFFVLCLYTYQVAALFVPVFLIGFSLIEFRSLLRRWKETLLALLAIAAVVAPGVKFYSDNRAEGQQYFLQTTILAEDKPIGSLLSEFAANYQTFFSSAFLFEEGDPVLRHSVRNRGELLALSSGSPLPTPYRYLSFWLLLLGAIACLRRTDRASKLVLVWIALYPVGPSLLNEIPTASRSFVGVPAFALLFGIGLAALLSAVKRVAILRPFAPLVQAICLAGVALLATLEIRDVLHEYFVEYPEYSAPTIEGWQFGYRDSMQFMESRRDQYETLIVTASDANQPYIFTLFYGSESPHGWQKEARRYTIARPESYAHYSLEKPVLYQLRERDLFYLSDYTILRRIVAPGGQVPFVVAEVRQRKNFLNSWLSAGPFDNRDERGIRRNYIDPLTLEIQDGVARRPWRPFRSRTALVDLNRFYRGDPDWSCAYVATTLHSETARDAFLEMNGSGDLAQVWLNGRQLTAGPHVFDSEPERTAIYLRIGDNLLLVKSCETTGRWHFTARVADQNGDDLREIASRAEILYPLASLASDGGSPAVTELTPAIGFEPLPTTPATSAATPADY